MKNIMYLLIISSTIFSAPECMDNSYHLKKRCDTKDYHQVVCHCPCEKQYKILANRGQCMKCKHFRDPSKSSILIEKGAIQCPVQVARNISKCNWYPKKLLKCKG